MKSRKGLHWLLSLSAKRPLNSQMSRWPSTIMKSCGSFGAAADEFPASMPASADVPVNALERFKKVLLVVESCIFLLIIRIANVAQTACCVESSVG